MIPGLAMWLAGGLWDHPKQWRRVLVPCPIAAVVFAAIGKLNAQAARNWTWRSHRYETQLWSLLIAAVVLAAQPNDEASLASHIDEDKRRLGIVPGVIDSSGKCVVSYGKGAAGDARPLDVNRCSKSAPSTRPPQVGYWRIWCCEASHARRPAQKFLPDEVTMPERSSHVINLRHFPTQRSGLPRLPGDLKPADCGNP